MKSIKESIIGRKGFIEKLFHIDQLRPGCVIEITSEDTLKYHDYGEGNMYIILPTKIAKRLFDRFPDNFPYETLLVSCDYAMDNRFMWDPIEDFTTNFPKDRYDRYSITTDPKYSIHIREDNYKKIHSLKDVQNIIKKYNIPYVSPKIR